MPPVPLVLPLHGLYNTGMSLNRTGSLVTAGQKFGRWTVVEDQKYTFIRKVLCECQCGNRRATSVHNLKSGRSKSCGCLSREVLANSGTQRRKHHLNPGDKFGRLTIINADRYAKVVCQCECGNTTTVTASNLYGGTTRSCGCLHHDLIVALGKKHRTQHGLSEHTLFGTWQRHVQGHRPMHQPWRESCQKFIQDVEAEIGPRPQGGWFRLKDDELGAVPGNIYWGTRVTRKGARTVLTPEQKREIAALVDAGLLQYQVAQEYQVSSSLVSSICRDPRYAVQ